MTLAKNILRYFSLKQLVIVLVSVLILIGTGTGIFLSMRKDVVLNVDGRIITATTMKSTVSEVLQQNNVSIAANDYLNLPLESQLQSGIKNEIIIYRAVPVYVKADGKLTTLMTYRSTVEEALNNSSIGISRFDKLKGIERDDKIIAGMQINVIRVNKKVVTTKYTIPYKVISRSSSTLNYGRTKILRRGSSGIIKRTYRLVYENGKLVSRKLLKTVRTRMPVSKIIVRGTAGTYLTARGDHFRYKRVLSMSASAYNCPSGWGRTATGQRARVGIIAVDPSVIPLGTRLYVEGYGYCVAGDTGGAIRGNRIDLYMNSYSECINWGRRTVKVYVL